MFKLFVIILFLVWFLGLFLGKKHRLIRSTSQLIQLILWGAFSFLGTTGIPRSDFFQGRSVGLALAILIWIAFSFWLSRFLVQKLDRRAR